jgi:hypothetical protein
VRRVSSSIMSSPAEVQSIYDFVVKVSSLDSDTISDLQAAIQAHANLVNFVC